MIKKQVELLTLRDASEPGDVFPRQARIDEGLSEENLNLVSIYVPGIEAYADSPSDTLILFDFLSLLNFRNTVLVYLFHAHVLLTASELRCINSDKETLDTSLLCMLHILPSDFTVSVDIPTKIEVMNKRVMRYS